MKKIALGLVCLALVMSCEIPQSLTLKGSPSLRIPLGSPFASLNEDQKLENYVSAQKIREMMGSNDDGGVTIYDYRGPDVDSDLQAYLIHYPIAEMTLDLSEYVRNATATGEEEGEVMSYTIPALGNFTVDLFLTGEKGPQQNEDPNDPTFKISLADMAKLVREVHGGPFGLEIGYTAEFASNLQVRIPAFGIDTYIQGTQAGNKLRFVNTPTDGKFIPKAKPDGTLNDANEIEIFVKVTGACSGTITPEMVFEWTDAIVYTNSTESLKGDYTISNNLSDVLGEGVNFKDTVKGYIYMNGIDTKQAEPKMQLGISGSTPLIDNEDLIERIRPPNLGNPNTPFTGTLADHSLQREYINLSSVLNHSGDSTLEYSIIINEMTITNDETSNEKVITFDLFILIPLEFHITSELTGVPTDISSEYVKLNIDLFDFGDGEDLFSRDPSGNSEDDDNLMSMLFDNLDELTISLTNIQNDIIDRNRIAILMISTDQNDKKTHKLLKFSDEKPSLSIDNLPNPFSPQFEILLKKDNRPEGGHEGHSTLAIQRHPNPRFDFFLEVEVKTNINMTIEFSELSSNEKE